MRPWFKARRYGWGWVPVAVQGWLVIVAYLAAVAVDSFVFVMRVRAGGDVNGALVVFLAWLAGLVALLLAVCRMTGERPRWRWGE